jgi:sortase (surface protein transpeptidase)
VVAVAFLLVAAGLLVAVRPTLSLTGLPLASGQRAGAAAGVQSPSTSAAPVPSATPNDLLARARAIMAPAAPPSRLVVPSIGVDATVEAVALDDQGRMATPSRSDRVAWYRPGSAPGDVGNAVIDGHLDWTSGPAVFWRLGQLRRGAPITVFRADGSQAQFVVDSTSQMPFDSSTDSLFTLTGPPTLTLITCSGSWDRQRGTYLQRLVVRATFVPPPPSEKPGDEGG